MRRTSARMGCYDMKWASSTFNWKDRDGDHVDLKPVFAELGLPILFIRSSGHQTRIKELNEVQDGIPDFHRLTIENTGHNMYMERPDAIADSLKEICHWPRGVAACKSVISITTQPEESCTSCEFPKGEKVESYRYRSLSL